MITYSKEKLTLAQELEMDLQYFTGTEKWYKHLTGLLYTDGIAYLADKAGAFWLIDAILWAQFTEKKVKDKDFQSWILVRLNDYEKQMKAGICPELYKKVDALIKQARGRRGASVEDSALLICTDGNNNIVSKQLIGFTDFPVPFMRLWFTNGVLLLPSEY